MTARAEAAHGSPAPPARPGRGRLNDPVGSGRRPARPRLRPRRPVEHGRSGLPALAGVADGSPAAALAGRPLADRLGPARIAERSEQRHRAGNDLRPPAAETAADVADRAGDVREGSDLDPGLGSPRRRSTGRASSRRARPGAVARPGSSFSRASAAAASPRRPAGRTASSLSTTPFAPTSASRFRSCSGRSAPSSGSRTPGEHPRAAGPTRREASPHPPRAQPRPPDPGQPLHGSRVSRPRRPFRDRLVPPLAGRRETEAALEDLRRSNRALTASHRPLTRRPYPRGMRFLALAAGWLTILVLVMPKAF